MPRLHVALAVITGPFGIVWSRRARPPYADWWSLPGGKLRHGEDPVDGARREVLEETGLEVGDGRLIAVVHERIEDSAGNHLRDFTGHVIAFDDPGTPLTALDGTSEVTRSAEPPQPALATDARIGGLTVGEFPVEILARVREDSAGLTILAWNNTDHTAAERAWD